MRDKPDCRQAGFSSLYPYFVRMKGLEPPLLSEPDPKSGAATNYATSAEVYLSANLHNNF